MNKDLVAFQKYFKDYQNKFGLNGYKIFYEYEPLIDCYAEIVRGNGNMAVTVRLNSLSTKEDLKERSLKDSAKHEALHLLLWKLERQARERYVSEHELDLTSEELVITLEELID